MVAPILGVDRKPVYASKCEAVPEPAACPYGTQTTSKAAFEQWFNTTADVNLAYKISFIFEPNLGVRTFQSLMYFPLDGVGFGNGPNNHNFSFTTEVHTKFVYQGGQMIVFTGDDDIWVFVNKKLALDLGGLHPAATGTIDMDAMAGALGLTVGTTYNLDFFQAERHTIASDLRIDTNFEFVDCGTLIP